MQSRRIFGILATAILIAAASPVWAAADEPPALNIGSRLEPFVDNYLIDSMSGASLRLHAPTPAEVVLAFDKPWEGIFCGYVTVFADGNKYRMYYRGLPTDGADGSDAETTCYAESADGINWTKPNLAIYDVKGTRENNVILANMPPFSHNFAPFLDTRPDVPPAERYKALAGTSTTGLAGFVSEDGTHWKKLREEALIRDGAFDSQNVAFWSESEKCYLCYFRTFTKDGIRTISRTTSTDFLTWTPPSPMTFGDTPMEHLYTNQTTPYTRAPQIYIAVAARFMPGRRIISPEKMKELGGNTNYSGDCSDAVFMTTRGGNQYDRTFMEAFIRPGIGMGNWTSRTNYPARGILQTKPEELSLYVQRNYGQASHHLQRLALRTDGFASINAPYKGGEAITKSLLFEGKNLVLNYATSAAGGMHVQIEDSAGKALPGFALADCDEIVGDEIERIVTWKNSPDISAFAGKSIRLHFALKDADVFSIRFRN